MENKIINNLDDYTYTYEEITNLTITSLDKIYKIINTEMLTLYWNIGKSLMKVQYGNNRADYGEKIIKDFSSKLTKELGNYFKISNLKNIQKFYCRFPNYHTISFRLSWSHYLELIKLEETDKRNYYLKETIKYNWSVEKLKQQISSLSYEKLKISRNKEKLLDLDSVNQNFNDQGKLINDPSILEFLTIKEINK